MVVFAAGALELLLPDAAEEEELLPFAVLQPAVTDATMSTEQRMLSALSAFFMYSSPFRMVDEVACLFVDNAYFIPSHRAFL